GGWLPDTGRNRGTMLRVEIPPVACAARSAAPKFGHEDKTIQGELMTRLFAAIRAAAAACAALVVAATAASAQTYPHRPVTALLPFPARRPPRPGAPRVAGYLS